MLKKIMRGCIEALVAIASVSLCLAMLLTAFDVMGRYFFNSPFAGSYELIELLMGFFSPVAILYCTVNRKHINVDILFDHLPKLVQAAAVAITAACELCMSAVIAYESVFLVEELIANGTATPVLDLPYWPAGCMIALSFTIMTVVYMAHLVSALLARKGGAR